MSFFITLHTFSDWGLLALRVAVGVIFLVHGAGKLALWKKPAAPQPPAPMSGLMRFLSIVEPLGGLAVLTGFLTQLAALGLAIIMIGAMYLKISKWKTPFTAHDKTGWELDFLIFCSALALYFIGAGGLSLDRLWLGF